LFSKEIKILNQRIFLEIDGMKAPLSDKEK
jgi:hypothetical protein